MAWFLDEDLIIAGQCRESRLLEVEDLLKAANVKYKVKKMLMSYEILVDDDNKEAAERIMGSQNWWEE